MKDPPVFGKCENELSPEAPVCPSGALMPRNHRPSLKLLNGQAVVPPFFTPL
jgi:hypothetical protein